MYKLIFLILLAFHVESASYYMIDIEERKYYKNDHFSSLRFALKANKKIKNFQNIKKIKSIFLQGSENHVYINGSLYIEKNTFIFEKAHWHKGNLILQNVDGYLTGFNFSTEKVIYNPTDNKVSIDNMFRQKNESFSKLRNFTYKFL